MTTGVSFETDISLGEYDPDHDIWVRSACTSSSRDRFHVDGNCSHHGDRDKRKDPATQFDDLVMCKRCRYRLMASEFTVDGETFRTTECTFASAGHADGRTLVCFECDWSMDYDELPQDRFGFHVQPPRCPDCDADVPPFKPVAGVEAE